jgi:translation elongation factor EF-Tu-like GTPase
MSLSEEEIDYSKVTWWHILVEARVTLLSTADGGRRKAVWENYSPNNKLPGGRFCSGRFTSVDGGKIEPGESGLVEIKFTVIEQLIDFFKEGLIWDIQEGGWKVGTGELLSIIEMVEIPKAPAPSNGAT